MFFPTYLENVTPWFIIIRNDILWPLKCFLCCSSVFLDPFFSHSYLEWIWLSGEIGEGLFRDWFPLYLWQNWLEQKGEKNLCSRKKCEVSLSITKRDLKEVADAGWRGCFLFISSFSSFMASYCHRRVVQSSCRESWALVDQMTSLNWPAENMGCCSLDSKWGIWQQGGGKRRTKAGQRDEEEVTGTGRKSCEGPNKY